MICYVIGGKGQRKEGKLLKNSFYMPAALLEMKAAYGKELRGQFTADNTPDSNGWGDGITFFQADKIKYIDT